MNLHVIQIDDLTIPTNRQRRSFPPEDLVKLADSISQNGLIQPPVVRTEKGRYILVAGERRIRAMAYVWQFGQSFKCGEYECKEGEVPCLFQGEMESLAAFEMELEENIRRADLTWQERAQATSQLYELRRLQAEKAGRPPPSVQDIADELRPEGYSEDSGSIFDATRKDIIVSKYLHDPDVAKAKSAEEGFKIIKRKEALRRSAELGDLVGKTFTSEVHKLLYGDCIELMGGLAAESFDVILTDPPYGINADQFGDSGGMTPGSHFYDDSFTAWTVLMQHFATASFRLAKPQAHTYVFCDIDNFGFLKNYMTKAGWKVFRTPFIWHNPSSMRAPWPEQGPQRKWQMCLYAIKGNRNVTRLYSDLIQCPSDENLNHPAQKPVALYQDLLRRSIQPGDSVLDPFCGTGTIFPAAHDLKCRATGIEIDPSAYGIAVKRLQELK